MNVMDEGQSHITGSGSIGDGPRLYLSELSDLLDGEWIGPPPADKRISGASTLITRIKPGQVFFVMDAEHWGEDRRKVMRQSGRSPDELARRAHAAGAVALVTRTPVPNSPLPTLVVESSRHALWRLGRTVRSQYRNPIVAITGSVGKSTTKEMLRHVLSHTDAVHASPRNWNTVDGVALTLSELLEPADVGVLEIAISGLARRESESTAFSAAPDIAVVTAIGHAHAHVDGSLSGTATLKARLFAGLRQGSGTAVVNLDTSHSDVLVSEARRHAARVVTYGMSRDADIRLLHYEALTNGLSVDFFGRRIEFELGVAGEHNAYNALAVLAVLDALGRDPREYFPQFKSFSALKGRGAVATISVGRKHITIVDQSYNANPLSMKATLSDFRAQFPESRRLLLLGDMLELGEGAPELHADLIDAVLAVEPDRVFLVGPLMGHLWSVLPDEIRGAHLSAQAQARLLLRQEVRDGDALFVKSSHGTGLHRVVASFREQSAAERKRQSWRVVVSGARVQGVGYRDWLVQRALRSGVNGWVRNRSDGKVEALVRGGDSASGAILSAMRLGPPSSEVDRLHVWKVGTIPKTGFRVREDRIIGDQ